MTSTATTPTTSSVLDVERIRRGVPNAAAGIDSERLEGRIRAAVLREREAFHECYTRVLAGTPDAAGGVVLGFTVETSGQVIDAVGDTSVQALRSSSGSCALRGPWLRRWASRPSTERPSP